MSGEIDGARFRWRLLRWFDANARDLPWRRSRDAYAIWVSEIMLQQTRVAAALEHYARFMERYPALNALAAASEDDVLAQWSGLGYYRRARMLHKAAQVVMAEMAGRVPSTAGELRKLPGVGEYTSAAIASIAFGEPVACVDGNVERVVRRLMGWDESSGTRALIRAEASRLLDAKRAGDFNQAMMELGATVCLPRGPRCEECPVREMCATRGEHSVSETKKMRTREAAYGFLSRTRADEVEVLLEQRAKGLSLMPGMWELPSVDAVENAPEKALKLRHSITVTNYRVTVYDLGSRLGRLPKNGETRRWFRVRELGTVPVTGLARKALMRMGAWPEQPDPTRLATMKAKFEEELNA